MLFSGMEYSSIPLFLCLSKPYLYHLKSAQKSALIFGKIIIDKLTLKCGEAP